MRQACQLQEELWESFVKTFTALTEKLYMKLLLFVDL